MKLAMAIIRYCKESQLRNSALQAVVADVKDGDDGMYITVATIRNIIGQLG